MEPKARRARVGIADRAAAEAGAGVPSHPEKTRLAVATLASTTRVQLLHLPLDVVRPNPQQPRKSFPEQPLRELVDSIRSSGLIQPVIVRPHGEGMYELVAGERRYRAFVELAKGDAKFEKIPAVVQDFSDADMPIASLIENVIREDLNAVERGEALKALKEHLDTDWDGVAARVGLAKRTIMYLAGTLRLREEFKDAIRDGRLTEKHGRALKLLGNTTKPAFELFEYFLGRPEVSGDAALDVAALMHRDAGLSAEEAAARVAERGVSGRTTRTPHNKDDHAVSTIHRGVKLLLSLHNDDLITLSQPTQRNVIRALRHVREHLVTLLAGFDS